MKYLRRFNENNINDDIEDILLELSDNDIRYDIFSNNKFRIYIDKSNYDIISSVINRISEYLNKTPIFKINLKFSVLLTSFRKEIPKDLLDKFSYVDVNYYTKDEIELRESLDKNDEIVILNSKYTVVNRHDISVVFNNVYSDIEEMNIYSDEISEVIKNLNL
jgi:hypothetical protein